MCGITGFWNFRKDTAKSELLTTVEHMAEKISHRGPDSFGVWCDETMGLAFGHRRLSIIDLSEAGHQPMISRSGRTVITYNGEIFNAPELKTELIAKGCEFRGHSDTEVILEACEMWGVEEACKRFIGMFAFAFWDKKTKILSLVRDRLGIKPLYWGLNHNILFFGSQLKSFSAHPQWSVRIDRSAIANYCRFNYIPAPQSIYEGIQKLSPATILTIHEDGSTKSSCFWNFSEVVEQGNYNRQSKNESQWVEELDSLLKDAVKRRMVADVPLGAFLSGGIDSSTVVALMQAQSQRAVKTFSIGFYEQEYNEAAHASLVAKHLHTEHHELYLHSNEAQAIIPEIANWYDEPFADASQIPTYLVSKMAREHVTVSLSGDGGDELFGGYTRYSLGNSIWQRVKLMPHFLRKMAAFGIHKVKPNDWDRLISLVPAKYKPRLFGDKLYKLADVMLMQSNQHFYRSLVTHWDHPNELVLGGEESTLHPWDTSEQLSFSNFIEKMQYLDTASYLPDDILTKVDRASMAVGLEARVPLLDHRVVEFAWQLPFSLKVREGQGKWILRQVLNKYVPRKLIDRPKMGFGVPIDQWLRGPLKEWAEDLLSYERIKSQGIFSPKLIQERWQEHLNGKRNWQYSIWGILMFQAWMEKWSS